MEDTEVVLVFECNNAGLKKLCQVFYSSAFLNPTYVLNLNRIFHILSRIKFNGISKGLVQ
jgi:hypothetical protein